MSAGSPVVPFVLGAEGMLGAAVARRLEAEYPGTVSATRVEADVTDRFRLEAEVERLQPTVLVNCAAFSDVGGCEIDPGRAWRTNVEGAENVARAAAAAGCRVVHLSTAEVFDGRSARPYTEADPAAPRSGFGRSKLLGESRVAAAAPDHLIVRASWLYGAGRANFVDAMRQRLADGMIVRAATDRIGSPTFVADLAEALGRLLGLEHRGVVHFGNRGSASRFQVAEAIAETLGAAPARLAPVTAEDEGGLALHPACAALDTSLYERLTGAAPRPWLSALRAYLGGALDGGADA